MAETRALQSIVLVVVTWICFCGCTHSSPPAHETASPEKETRQQPSQPEAHHENTNAGTGSVRVLGTVPPFRLQDQDGKG
ncbi:MAG: hypothetical protein MK108_18625, partial [Mariniblastus sp.]|nr:hypothetical protein [Mariniblastus sp.]